MAMLYGNLHYSEACYDEVELICVFSLMYLKVQKNC